MAIADLKTNMYYKVFYEESYIKNNLVYVHLTMYQSKEERDKEKARHEKQFAFIQKLSDKIVEYYNQLDDKGISEDEERALPPNVYVKYRNIDRLFFIGDPEERVYDEEELKPLIDLGLEMIWLTDPIKMSGDMVVEIGEFDNCAITKEYLYNKLKPQMINAIIDC